MTTRLTTILFLGAIAMTTACTTTHVSTNTLETFLLAQGYFPVSLGKNAPGHLILRVTINGVEGTFILDTGAGGTVVDESAREKFNLHADSTAGNTGAGAGGADLSVAESKENQLSIEKWTVDTFTLHIMNLEHVNGALRSLGENSVDGVIGADILTLGTGIIDYSGKTLYLRQVSESSVTGQ